MRDRRPRDRWYLTGRTAVLGALAGVAGLVAGLNPSLQVTVWERLGLIGMGIAGLCLLVLSVDAIADRW